MTENMAKISGSNRKINVQEVEKEVETKYHYFHTFIFKILPLLILFGILGFVFYYYISNFSLVSIEKRDEEEKKIRNELEILTNYKIGKDLKDVSLIIKNGYLNFKDKRLQSSTNLIQVKGWIMPRYIDVNLENIPSIESFSYSGYKISELEKTIKNIIINNKIEKTKENLEALKIENLRNFFSLDCLFGIRLGNRLCNKYTNSFLDSFYLYNLDLVAKELNSIYYKLDTKKREIMCNNLLIYTNFSHSENIDIITLLKGCGKKYIEEFNFHKSFFSSNSALDKSIVSSKNIHNTISDLYLLLSLQQIIYNKIEKGTININLIIGYLNFIDIAMIKRKEKVFSPIYYDWTYYFNNNILKKKLEELRYGSISLQKDIEKILPYILRVDEGNPSIEVYGLKNFIMNKDLIKIKDNNINISKWKELSTLEKVINLTSTLSYFALIDSKYQTEAEGEEKNVILEGYFIINNNGKNYNLNTTLTIDPSFRVIDINIKKYTNFSNTLNKLLKNNNFSLPELHQYITKNINFYIGKNINNGLGFCDTLKLNLENILKNKDKNTEKEEKFQKNERNFYCNENQVDIIIGKLTYSIGIDGLGINKILVNDFALQKALNKSFLKDTPSELDLISLIEDIVNYKITKKEEKEIFSGSTDVIIALDSIKEYMNLSATDIVESGGNILAEITVQEIPFIIHLDINSNNIKEVFFKGVQIDKDGLDLKVYNFNLELSKDNRRKINMFLIEPLRYIKSVNPRVYLEYLRYKRGKSSSKKD